jgi:hypothetical protein
MLKLWKKSTWVESTKWTASGKNHNANGDEDDDDDMSEFAFICDDNDEIQGVGPIISDSEWREVKWVVKWSELWWSSCGQSEVKCVTVKFLWTEVPLTLYWGYLIILWLLNLGISCTIFVFTCTVVVLNCFVMWGCVCVSFIMCVFWKYVY